MAKCNQLTLLPFKGLTASLGVIPCEYADEPYNTKTRVNGLQIMKAVHSFFDIIPACDGRTDGQIDRSAVAIRQSSAQLRALKTKYFSQLISHLSSVGSQTEATQRRSSQPGAGLMLPELTQYHRRENNGLRWQFVQKKSSSLSDIQSSVFTQVCQSFGCTL